MCDVDPRELKRISAHMKNIRRYYFFAACAYYFLKGVCVGLILMLVALIILSMLSCGTTPDIKPIRHYDDNLREYVDLFLVDSVKYHTRVTTRGETDLRTVEWRYDLKPFIPSIDNVDNIDFNHADLIGVCVEMEAKYRDYGDFQVNKIEWREIYINLAMADEDPIFLKSVMYHELGHCLLNRPDTRDQTEIMSLISNKDAEYVRDNWDKMVEYLFTQRK